MQYIQKGIFMEEHNISNQPIHAHPTPPSSFVDDILFRLFYWTKDDTNQPLATSPRNIIKKTTGKYVPTKRYKLLFKKYSR